MQYVIRFTVSADAQLRALEADAGLATKLKAVRKTLALMEANLRHPGLNTHEFHSLSGPNGEKVFEAYAQNKTPGAHRVFFCYPNEKTRPGICNLASGFACILVITISSHP